MRNTKALIADAFAQLLEEKPYRRITVRDIVERCGVNRNTFYRYYPDIPSSRPWSRRRGTGSLRTTAAGASPSSASAP